MSFVNILSENIILPLGDFLTNRSISKTLGFLMKSQYWNKNQICEFQEKQLRKLITHSVDSVPYYRDLFNTLGLKAGDIKTKDDLKKLPILTKETIRKEGIGSFTSTAIQKNKLIIGSSSGSTGEPLLFYSTKESETFLKAAAIRGWYWMGYRLGDKYVKISMNPRKSIKKKIQDYANNCVYLSSTQLTKKAVAFILGQIGKSNPKIIRGYPIPLLFLADELEKIGNIKLPKLSAVNSTGSTLHENIREKIEKVFNVKIYDSYSCEGGSIFSQCENLDNYHPAEEYAISEFIEDDFTNQDQESPKRHISTDLFNYAFPFIRYDTQDYIVMGRDSICPCGRHFININKIKGRDSDILITPSGKYLIVENFVAYFEWIPSVEQFQVYQEKIDLIKMRFIVNSQFTNKVKLELAAYWQDYIGNDVKIIFEIVDEIKLTSTGKRRNVIRNPEIKLN